MTLALLPGQGAVQSVSTGLAPSSSAFASPGDLKFEHIRDAFAGKDFASGRFRTYAVQQTRRERDEHGQWFGILEDRLFRPADALSKTPSRFRLEFRGLEGKQLSANQFVQQTAKFAQRAAFTEQFKSFGVADPVRAEAAYRLEFLVHATRRTDEGLRPIYRCAVIPKGWDRAAWLLELDVETGYPLYCGCYAVTKTGALRLDSELIVTSFLANVRTPAANHPTWWKPSHTVQQESDASTAARKALRASPTFVVPESSDFHSGFEIVASQLHIDPYTGHRQAVLRLTDGINQQLVSLHNVKRQPRGIEDSIKFLQKEGFAYFSFEHLGISFRVVGRADKEHVREASVSMYRRAITDVH